MEKTEKEVFCEQVRLCEAAMYRLAFSLVRNDADAGDVMSEAIYRAYRNLDTLKNERAFKAWILRIVHNTAVELIRKNTKTVPFAEIEGVRESGENRLADAVTLRAAVDGLKQPYRTVVVLYYYEDFSVAQIAKVTDSTTDAVKKQLSRARKQLYEALKEDFKYA